MTHLTDLAGPVEQLTTASRDAAARTSADVLERRHATDILDGLERDGIIRVIARPDAALNVHRELADPNAALVELAHRLVDTGLAAKMVAADAPADIAGQVHRALFRLAEAVERIEDAAGDFVSDRTSVALALMLDVR